MYSNSSTMSETGGGVGAAIVWIVYLGVIVLLIAAMWRVYTKAGKPGWAALIPFYNYIVQLEIVGRPVWWFVLLFIPFVNFVVLIILANDLSKSFGKGTGTTVLLVLLPFIGYPMLAWGSATYVGPAAGTPMTVPNQGAI